MPINGPVTTYTPELAAKICALLMRGLSLRRICEIDEDDLEAIEARASVGLSYENMPHESTVRAWAVDNRDNFYTQYVRARDIGLDSQVDELLTVARKPKRREKTKAIRTLVSAGNGETTHDEVIEVQTEDAVDRSRLYVDTLKWYASKMAPKRYGDKLALEHSGTISVQDRLPAARKRTRKE